MKRIWSAAIALSCLAIASCRPGDNRGAAASDASAKDLAKWVATDPPKPDSDRWRTANSSSREWSVTLREGRPFAQFHNPRVDDSAKLPFTIERAMAADGLAGDIYATKVGDGWIVGFNAGEFGAGLWWFSPDGKQRYKISQDQVCAFLETDRGLLALEGLAHLGLSRGQLIRISPGENGKWKSEPLADLKDEPGAATRDMDGSLLVVTYERLLRVRPDNRVDVLIDKAFWAGLYPNSIVVDASGTVYIGMRFGVAKLTSASDKWIVAWLVPNKAADAGR